MRTAERELRAQRAARGISPAARDAAERDTKSEVPRAPSLGRRERAARAAGSAQTLTRGAVIMGSAACYLAPGFSFKIGRREHVPGQHARSASHAQTSRRTAPTRGAFRRPKEAA